MNKPFTLNPFLWAFRKAGGELVYNKLVAPFFRMKSSRACTALIVGASILTGYAAINLNASFAEIIRLVQTNTAVHLTPVLHNAFLNVVLLVTGLSLRGVATYSMLKSWQNWGRSEISKSLYDPKLRGIYACMKESERDDTLQRCTTDTQSLINWTTRLPSEGVEKITLIALTLGAIANLSASVFAPIAVTIAGIFVGMRAAKKRLLSADMQVASTTKAYAVSVLNTAKRKIAIEQWRGEKQEARVLHIKQEACSGALNNQTKLRIFFDILKNVAHGIVQVMPYFQAGSFAEGKHGGAPVFGEIKTNTDLLLGGLSWVSVLAEPVNAWRGALKRINAYIKKVEDPAVAESFPSYERGDQPALFVKDLAVTVHDKALLCSDITLELKAGDKLALTGSSGSGKSTLLRQLSGTYPFPEGSITFRGLSGPDEALFVPQKDYIPDLPFADVLAYPSSAEDFKPEEISNVLHAVGLEKKAHLLQSKETGSNFEATFSGGEKQRVNFARLLLNKPAVIGLDEATSALPEQDGLYLYKLLCQRLPNSIIISSVHRMELLDLHTSQGTIKDGKLTLSPLPAARNNAVPPKPQPLNIA